MMLDILARHLLKSLGILCIFLGIVALAAAAISGLSRWFLRRRGLLDAGASRGRVIARAFRELARSKPLAMIAVVLACLLLRAVLIPVLKVPAPKDQDEFSYLLAGDTFAHGRLTNPTHPMWMHFESEHVNQQPTYMSMYPPGQGFILAAGELLGHPWIGVWLSTALACGLICWMLQAWLPPTWALLGGVLAILQFGLLSYWANSYYCTALPVIGGALVLGAFARLKKRPRAGMSLLLGFGVCILALTRPYEGLVFSVPVAVALLLWVLGKKRPAPRITLTRVVAPAALLLALLGAFLAYDNWRVSGNPLVLPYQLNQQRYKVVPLFAWQPLRQPPPPYRHIMMRNYYARWEVSEYRNTMTHGVLYASWIKFERYVWFYFGPFLMVPLLALPWAIPDKRIRFLLIVVAITAVGLDVETWSNPHYAAPIAAALFAVLLQSMRHLYRWNWRGKEVGKGVVAAVVLGGFLLDAAWVSVMVMQVNSFPLDKAMDKLVKVDYNFDGNQERAAIERQMEHMPGGQLLIVRYKPTHLVHLEWVYNRADIDHAKVVWARDMGEECNQELINYFRDRRVWLVEPDEEPPRVRPYFSATAAGGRSPAAVSTAGQQAFQAGHPSPCAQAAY